MSENQSRQNKRRTDRDTAKKEVNEWFMGPGKWVVIFFIVLFVGMMLWMLIGSFQ